MTATRLRPIVGYIQQLASRTVQAEATDRQLLERFARERDEEAFRVLVRRHGPLVLGVSRRSLRHRQDAEDCFQATFMVLARKAGSVHWHESIAGWLHQVATRLAAEIRVRDARRRRRERIAVAEAPPVNGESTSVRELGSAVDDELGRLPERFRLPLLLCYLQGQTRDQAARRLGVSLRTLERRLQAARAMLGQRLARRGITLSAGLLAWGIAQEGFAVPPEVVAVTVRETVDFISGSVASRAAVVAGHALRAMLWEKLRWAAGLVLALGIFTTMIGSRAQPSTAVPPMAFLREHVSEPPPALVAQKPPAPPTKIREVATAKAVQDGLRWVVRQQTKEGGWRIEGGAPNDVAATAFGLLPLLQAAADAEPAAPFGPHGEAVRRGLKHLAAMQKPDGGFDGGMYAHALAAWALADGYRLTADARLKLPAQRALDFIVNAQHEGGGWRYAPKQPGDTSVTSWHVLALKRGQQAGLQVPKQVFDNAARYLDSAASDGGAAYGYTPAAPVGTPAMTAGGLMCRQLLGWKARDPRMLKGAAKLAQNSPAPSLTNAYYYHFATRMMQGVGGPEWEAWETKLARLLLGRQERDGSWAPAGDTFGQAGGRLMITSLSLMSLEACGQLNVPAAHKLKDGEAAECWDDLAADDFGKVKRAMLRLVGAPTQAVPLLRERLKPAPAVDAKVVARLIADLGADQFETREAAFRELRTLGDSAALPLREALKTAKVLELRRRLEQLLDDAERKELAPDRVRLLRAIQILELAGSADARQVLQALAAGAPGARLTRAAKEALDRDRR
jgi:RNA polymerase sigma factor (sigma-70 family)